MVEVVQPHPYAPQAGVTGTLLRLGDKGIGQRPSFGFGPPSTHRQIPSEKGAAMQAITVRDHDAGVSGLSLTDVPYPHAAQNDVIVRVHAAGFTPGELEWSSTWVDRAGRDRTPSVPGHELSGVVVELGYGTTGLTVGQRVFGMTD